MKIVKSERQVTQIHFYPDELLETPQVFSTDGTLTDPNLLLFQESWFSSSTSAAPTIHSSLHQSPNLTFQRKFLPKQM